MAKVKTIPKRLRFAFYKALLDALENEKDYVEFTCVLENTTHRVSIFVNPDAGFCYYLFQLTLSQSIVEKYGRLLGAYHDGGFNRLLPELGKHRPVPDKFTIKGYWGDNELRIKILKKILNK